MKKLAGKTAIITGASRGIGKAIALRLAEEGAQVVLTARDEAILKETVDQIQASGGSSAAIALDLRDKLAAARVVDFATGHFGSLNIVVNNAGATKRGE